MNEASSSSTTTTPEFQPPILPDHLIIDHILPRLPVKTLIRFKSVSKHWNSTISSYEFHKTYLNFISNNPTNQSFIILKSYDHNNSLCNFLSLDKSLNVKEFIKLGSKYDLSILPGSLKGVGSCNGIVCLYDRFRRFYLWNPVTNQCRKVFRPDSINAGTRYIPRIPIPFHLVRERAPFVDAITGVGFGYVSWVDDYRIGLLWRCDDGSFNVYVFSLKSGEWKLMGSFDSEYYLRVSGNAGVFIDGMVYLAPVIYSDRENHMVGLDLVSGQLERIPLAGFGRGYEDVTLFESKGYLLLYCTGGCDVYDVWIVKQLDERCCWEKILSFERGGEFCLPFYVSEKGECLVGRPYDKLLLYRPSEVAASEHYGEGSLIWQGSEEEKFVFNFDGAWGYVESLISPFGTPWCKDVYDDGEDYVESLISPFETPWFIEDDNGELENDYIFT